VRERQARDDPAGVGVVHRRALAGEVGQHDEAVAAGGHRLGLRGQLLVARRVVGEQVAEPAGEDPGGGHARGDGDLAGEQVGGAPERRAQRQLGHDLDEEHRAAVHEHEVARAAHAHADGLSGGVGQAGLLGCCGVHGAGLLRRPTQRRHRQPAEDVADPRSVPWREAS
jgi:hypothetical protein